MLDENRKGASHGIMTCNGTGKLFEVRKELANAMHVLQCKLRHINEESAERVRVSTSKRDQETPRNVCLTSC